ncbi:MAG: hypothetical protein HOL45_08100, partial [Chloroflexi bacterium]|nr:hypothetical protein [Chloroflexota bacterium]
TYVVALIQISCSGPTKLKFAASAGLPNPPTEHIRLWIPKVVDFSGSYEEQKKFYDLSPDLSERIAVALEPVEFQYIEDGYKHHIENPFTIVSDSTEAQMSLSIAVVDLGYGTKADAGSSLAKFAAFGVFSLMMRDKPHGFLAITCQLKDLPTQETLYEFEAAALSISSGQRSVALEEALEAGAAAIVKRLIEPTSGY